MTVLPGFERLPCFCFCDHQNTWRKLDFKTLRTTELHLNRGRSIKTFLDRNNMETTVEEAIAFGFWEVLLPCP